MPAFIMSAASLTQTALCDLEKKADKDPAEGRRGGDRLFII